MPMQSREKYNKYGNNYIKHFFDDKTGGFVVSHIKHNKYELAENVRIGKILAKEGYRIELLAVKDKNNIKSADALVNKTIYEFKENRTNSMNSIDNAIRTAKNQANNIVLNVRSSINKGKLLDAMTNRLRRTDNILKVIIIYKGTLYRTNRKAIINNIFKIE